MDSQQEQKQPAPVLAWHREAAKATCAHAEHWYRGPGKTLPDGTFGEQMSAIIAQHDPHAETVRLLEELDSWVESTDGYEGESSCLRHQVRAHLAKLKGTQ